MDELEDDLVTFCRARVGGMLRDKWHLDRMLGIGGMAAVYAATHRNGTTAALKVLHPQYAAVPGIRDRFLREAYIANKARHDGIVKVRDDEVDERGSPFLVMELLEGESVAQRADAIGGRLPPKDAVWVGQELLTVLAAAHAQGIVHRDIKPDNLFWTTGGHVKVLDFGIARLREDAPSGRTKTGMVFGTPGYMAPEQALGRWSEVTAQTDLWAVGATIFNLLTGESVHEGETDNERVVNAATRPARSLGAAMPGAPTPLVAVVDRALAFDPRGRYPDALAMKDDLDRAVVGLAAAFGLGGPRRFSENVPTQLDTRGAPAKQEEETVPEVDEIVLGMAPAAAAAMRDLALLLEKAMKARLQYGEGHKEVERRVDVAMAAVTAALDAHEGGLAFQIRAYGFTLEAQPLWEPKPPLDQVTYRLFSDGIRAMALLPGLRRDELAGLVKILAADASSAIAPGDNLVTLLWDARFDHVLYEEGEPFAEGDQAERLAFAKKRAEILAGANLDTSDQLEDAWRAHARKGPDEGQKQRALLGAVAPGSAASAATAAAQTLNMRPGVRFGALGVEPSMKAVLHARLAAPRDVGERFATAASAAWVLAARKGEPALVAAPLRASVEGLSGETAADDTLALISLLVAGVGLFAKDRERDAATAALVNALVSPRRLASTTAAVLAADATATRRSRFEAVLERIDGSHVATLATTLSTMEPTPLRERLLNYVAAHAAGHEGEIGSTFAKGHLDPSLALLKILTRLGTPAAREAAQEATRSPHPIVRIEALGLVEGASGIGIRQALRAMLEDWDPSVRLAALRSIGAYRVKVAGPGLVMRVKSPEFDGLPLEERREALSALFMLTAARAEALAVELLADTRLVAAELHEQTRAVAAEVLGLHGRTTEGRAALEAASRGRWKNSERVRAAAASALASWAERSARESEPPPSSALGSDLAIWGGPAGPPRSISGAFAAPSPTEPPPPTSKR